MTAKQYRVLVGFHEVDPKSGENKRYEPGDTYSGDNAESHLKGVDDQGPLIVAKSDKSGDSPSAPTPSPAQLASDSSKEG